MIRALARPADWPRVTQGIALMLLATLTSAVMNALVKWLSASFDSTQVLFFRFLFALPAVLLLALRGGWLANLRTARPGAHIVRAVIGVASLALYFAAFPYLPLAELIALAFTQPLFVAALSKPMLGEHVGLHRWAAIITGFIGVLIMLRPGGNPVDLSAALLVVASCALWAASAVMTRQLSATDRSTAIVFYFLLVGAVLNGVPLPLVWITPSGWDWLLLLILGVFATGSQYTMTEAYRRAQAAVVAPYYYVTVVWTTLLGWALWGELPDLYMIVGTGVLVASGIYLAVREARLAPARPAMR